MRAGLRSKPRNQISMAARNSDDRDGLGIGACGVRLLILFILLCYCLRVLRWMAPQIPIECSMLPCLIGIRMNPNLSRPLRFADGSMTGASVRASARAPARVSAGARLRASARAFGRVHAAPELVRARACVGARAHARARVASFPQKQICGNVRPDHLRLRPTPSAQI